MEGNILVCLSLFEVSQVQDLHYSASICKNFLFFKTFCVKLIALQVPLSISSLNQGDCFVLDSGRKLFVWIGKESNKKERFTVSFFCLFKGKGSVADIFIQ